MTRVTSSLNKGFICLLITLFTLSFIGVSQETIHVAGITIEAIKPQGEIPYEKWIQSEDGAYAMIFKQTTVGYKHCLDKVKEILEINNLSFDNNRVKESILIPSHCDGIFDYYCLPIPFTVGKAEVVIAWRTEEGDAIGIVCNDEAYLLALYRGENLD